MLDVKGTVRTQIYIYLIVWQIEHIITITITGAFLLARRIVIYIIWLKWCTCYIYAYNYRFLDKKKMLLPHLLGAKRSKLHILSGSAF